MPVIGNDMSEQEDKQRLFATAMMAVQEGADPRIVSQLLATETVCSTESQPAPEPEKDPPLLRIIGDVHGKIDQYTDLADDAQYSICLGDVGFNYYWLKELDPTRHRCIGGNHDNYDALSEHFLGDFGVHTVPGFGDIFYVRGAWSIDHGHRNKSGALKSWWAQEEMTDDQMEAAYKMYCEVKPDFVLTHDAPLGIIGLMNLGPLPTCFELGPQRTPRLLHRMFLEHQPKTWLFGHFHKHWCEYVKGTYFRCLPELAHMDFEAKP
jgi:predicted phosphodiesterase